MKIRELFNWKTILYVLLDILLINAAAFFALRKWRANPILVMTLCGAAGLLLGCI